MGAAPPVLHLPTGMDECTFKPATNDVRVADMPSAAIYVRAPIFERLSRTNTRGEAGSAAAAAAAAAGGLGSPVDGGRRSMGRGSTGGGELVVDPEERRAAQEALLARQAAMVERRDAKVAELAAGLAPVGQPQLCTRSLAMVEESKMGGFLERVATEVARKEQEALKTKARLARDPECTFKPAINPASKSLPGRSMVELSRGDALKRENAVRLVRLRAEAEQLEGITFTPAINPRSAVAESRLGVRDNPAAYMARLAEETAAAAERARAAAEEQKRSELADCTFAPRVHDAPEYVKRIARSMALARAVRPPTASTARPEWR